MTERRFTIVPFGDAELPPGSLVDAVQASLRAMPWLKPSDSALSALAVQMAEQIDTAVARGEELRALYGEVDLRDRSLMERLGDLEAACNVVKVTADLGPKLLTALRDLGATPATRKTLTSDAPAGGRLAAFRAGAAATR